MILTTLENSRNPENLKTPKEGSFAHKSELIAWRGGKAHEACVGSVATGSHQVLPRGLA